MEKEFTSKYWKKHFLLMAMLVIVTTITVYAKSIEVSLFLVVSCICVVYIINRDINRSNKSKGKKK